MAVNPVEIDRDEAFSLDEVKWVLLEVAKAELDAVEEYSQFLRYAKDEKVRRVLEYIIRDEMEHFALAVNVLMQIDPAFATEVRKVLK
ncbi:hypothetical protein PFV2_gp37 [Pyrobaculum filamentous virus 2]|uniref:Rubrerythrin diiron-binding domain-containing protein n=1 Tax=Pyrobaculum filamentous virus 2 TaxID=2730621 RepID=A0A6M3VZ02_PFV2|nr:hypothetical protein QIT34_gp37 [Pyrobaculum filamentous virus 2]QJF12410.1 hypothetical protein PFV2_gp37 [Pyrobaculum filamentous virus 2]